MKVAMIGWEFPPFMAGGLGIHCLELTTQLSRMGVAIDFYMPHIEALEGGMRVAEHHRHLNIIEVEADPGIGPYEGRRGYEESFNDAVWQYNRRVVDAFRSADADVVHAHDWITFQAAAEIKRRTGKPLVWSCHSTEYDRSAGFFPQDWIIEMEKEAVRTADLVIAVSEYTRRQLIDRYGAEPDKVVPIHNGVDFSKWAEHSTRDYLPLARLAAEGADELHPRGEARHPSRPERPLRRRGKGRDDPRDDPVLHPPRDHGERHVHRLRP
jgi:glycogen synthase